MVAVAASVFLDRLGHSDYWVMLYAVPVFPILFFLVFFFMSSSLLDAGVSGHLPKLIWNE